MDRLYLVRSVAPLRLDRRSARVISLAVRREARKDAQRLRPAPEPPRAA
jgi:hypothetical protein